MPQNSFRQGVHESFKSQGQSCIYWVKKCLVVEPQSLASGSHLYCPGLQMAGHVYFFPGFHRRKTIMWSSSLSLIPYKALSQSTPSSWSHEWSGSVFDCFVFYLLISNWKKRCDHKGFNSFNDSKCYFHFYLKNWVIFVVWKSHLKSVLNLTALPSWLFTWTSLASVAPFDFMNSVNVSHCYWWIRRL